MLPGGALTAGWKPTIRLRIEGSGTETPGSGTLTHDLHHHRTVTEALIIRKNDHETIDIPDHRFSGIHGNCEPGHAVPGRSSAHRIKHAKRHQGNPGHHRDQRRFGQAGQDQGLYPGLVHQPDRRVKIRQTRRPAPVLRILDEVNPVDFQIPPKQDQEVRFTATVPDSAVGTHWAVIFFESVPESLPPKGQFGINLAGRLGSIIYVTPSGNGKKAMRVLGFQVQPYRLSSP